MSIAIGIGIRLEGGADGGGAVAFNPLTLSPYAWYDASDLTTLYQDDAATTPVTAAGQSIGRAADKSGNAHHMQQATAGNKPTYRVTGGKGAINPDGVDDKLATLFSDALNLSASVDVYIVCSNVENDTSFILMSQSGYYLGVAGGTGSVGATVSGNPSVYVNNSAAITDRGALLTAIGTTNIKIVEFRAVNLSDWATIMTLSGFAGFEFGGRYHEVLLFPALSGANQTSVRSYLTTKWGVA